MPVLSAFDRGFSAITVDVGTLITVLIFIDEVRRRIKHLHGHTVYINAVLRCGHGASIGLLLLLSVAQVASCAIIALPSLYRRMGTAIPSLALGSTALVELLLYHGFRDSEILFKVLILELCLLMVGLLRRDAQARIEAIGIPVSGIAVVVEANVRKCSTRLHTALFCPTIASLVFAHAVRYHAFWMQTGTNFEIKRTTFTLCMAECALLAFLAGQDRSTSRNLFRKCVRVSGQLYRLLHGRFACMRQHNLKKSI